MHNQPQVNANGEARLQQVNVMPIITTYMHTVDFDMIMNCSQSKLLSPDSETPSPEQQRTPKFYSLSFKTWNKLLPQLHQTMSQTYLNEKMPFAWMR